MDKERLKDWKKAGSILKEAQDYSRTILKPGTKVFDFCEKVEDKIRSLGGIPGFPVNVSSNDIAAHYTAVPGDETEFSDQIVKIDIGTCYNGAIGDAAYTIDLSGKYSDLVKASAEALANAEKMIQVGTTLGDIGKTIIETIQSFGHSPVKNLSGHGLGNFSVHEPPSIPNYDTHDKSEIVEDMTFAIEPFATDGAGLIKESGIASIFSLSNPRPVRDLMTRKVLAKAKQFQGLPFAKRWLVQDIHEGKVNFALRQMENQEMLRSYPPLREVRQGMVSQAENTFVMDGDRLIITTK
jgi:methionyl aminopeptidase